MLALSAARATTSLNFVLPDNDPTVGYEQILNYYNGGADQNGAIGPNYGVVFGSDALALMNYPNQSNVGNEPQGGNSMIFLNGSDLMNVTGGFTGGFSFYYSAYYDGSVTVWDGLNGTGNLLATLSLPAANTPTNYPNEPYYNIWAPVGVAFNGTAYSVNFSGTANFIAFSDVTFGSDTPSTAPDAGSWSLCALAALALGAAAWTVRRTEAA